MTDFKIMHIFIGVFNVSYFFTMLSMKLFLTLVLFISLFFSQSCSHKQKTTGVKNDKTQIVDTVEENCTTAFFNSGEKENNSQNVFVEVDGRKSTLAAFIDTVTAGDDRLKEFVSTGLFDLDGDGKKELVMNGYTGGAHCCDIFHFFENIEPNTYRHVGSTFAGDVCPVKGNTFNFYFFQSLGYFFTCYACGYSTDEYTPIGDKAFFSFKYDKGKLVIIPGNAKQKEYLIANLKQLSKQPYKKIEDDGMDDGLRKEYALTIATYYFSFGKDMGDTKMLFDKYYTFPDATKVWNELASNLQYIADNNDF